MSVTTLTNRSTNPALTLNTTGYAAVAGTGGTANLAWNSGAGYVRDGFGRVTWTVGTTANSGGASFTQTGISANTAHAFTMWVWSSRATAMRLTVVCRNSSNATVNTLTGSATQIPATEWTPVRVTGTTGSNVTNVVMTAAVFTTTGAAFWQAGDTLDIGATLIETGTTLREYYDGSTPDGGGTIYAWTGAEDASTSTATVYSPVITLTALTTAPCPRVQITITDFDPFDNVITVWRTADGKRSRVRGARDWTIIGADTVTDYEAPLGVPSEYSIIVSEGISAQLEITPASITLNDTKGWIQDPIDPSTAVPLYPDVGPNGEPSFTYEALKRFDYEAGVSLINILGSDTPVALIGQRMVASNVPFHMFTDVAQQSTNLRNLLKQAAPVLIRPLPTWARALPASCYLSVATVSELPVDESFGGQVVEWQLTANLVSAPTVSVIIAVITYGDVQALYSTYQQAQTQFTGNTYLQVKQNPSV